MPNICPGEPTIEAYSGSYRGSRLAKSVQLGELSGLCCLCVP
jgi:hypothetical protein